MTSGTVRETKTIREEHVSEEQHTSLIDKLFDRMPAWQRSILLFFMILPLTLALSGLLLQVNVGGILSRYIDYLYEAQKVQTRDIDKIVDDGTTAVQGDIAASRESIEAMLAAFNLRLGIVERAVDSINSRVGKIERYICDTDGKRGYGACALDKDQ